MRKKSIDDEACRRVYSEDKLRHKLQKVARKAGMKVAYAVLIGFYLLTDPKVPKADKAKILAALGYFILPLDLVPDAVPVGGYVDDLLLIVGALKSVWVNVTPDMKERAKEKLCEWFDDVDEEDLKLF